MGYAITFNKYTGYIITMNIDRMLERNNQEITTSKQSLELLLKRGKLLKAIQHEWTIWMNRGYDLGGGQEFRLESAYDNNRIDELENFLAYMKQRRKDNWKKEVIVN